MAEQKRLFQLDIRDLLKRKKEFVTVSCPACQLKKYKPEWRKYTLTFVTCAHCGTVFTNPRPTPEILDYYYRHSRNYAYWNTYIFPVSENARREKIFKPRAHLIKRLCAKHGINTGTLVDVGAGFGTGCEEVKRLKLFRRIIAVEPNPELAKTCRAKGIETIEQRIEDSAFNGGIDVITNYEVIEHLFSPKDFLRGCATALPRGGIIIITCPNGLGFDVSVLKEVSDVIDIEHLNYFNPHSLGLLLERYGFTVIERLTPGKLDAELVRKKTLAGEFNLDDQPFLKRVLIDEWDRLGEKFQAWISEHGLSSNMLLVARKN